LFGPQGGAVGSAIGAVMAAGVSIGGDVVVSSTEQRINRLDLISGPHGEIAYLHGLAAKLSK
jgi:hypothetical protein